MTPASTAGTNSKNKGGFASMDPARQREIASQGGRAAHAKGAARKFDTDTGRQAALARRRPQQGTATT